VGRGRDPLWSSSSPVGRATTRRARCLSAPSPSECGLASEICSTATHPGGTSPWSPRDLRNMGWQGDRLLRWQREKQGTVELGHGVMKNDLGGGVLPCSRFGLRAPPRPCSLVAAQCTGLQPARPEEGHRAARRAGHGPPQDPALPPAQRRRPPGPPRPRLGPQAVRRPALRPGLRRGPAAPARAAAPTKSCAPGRLITPRAPRRPTTVGEVRPETPQTGAPALPGAAARRHWAPEAAGSPPEDAPRSTDAPRGPMSGSSLRPLPTIWGVPGRWILSA